MEEEISDRLNHIQVLFIHIQISVLEDKLD